MHQSVLFIIDKLPKVRILRLIVFIQISQIYNPSFSNIITFLNLNNQKERIKKKKKKNCLNK